MTEGEWQSFASQLERQIMRESLKGFESMPGLPANMSFNPKVDIVEESGGVRILVELPGVGLEDVKISVLGDSELEIFGRKKSHARSPATYHTRERSVGEFYRKIVVPHGMYGNY